jgi:hypothetical protein
VTWAQSFTIIAAVAGIVGLQSFWITRTLDAFKETVDRRFAEVERRLDRIEDRLDRIEQQVLRDHGERIVRLEERLPGVP